MDEQGYSLREKKYARTKVGLMNAFIERLHESRFENISIRDVCKKAEVAEGTFFNYFPEKMDVINYYMSLLMIKLMWHVRAEVSDEHPLAMMEAMFQQMARELKEVNVVYQIISVVLAQSSKPTAPVITELEKKTAFPDLDGIERIPSMQLEDFFKACVQRAAENGEIPAHIRCNDLVVSLMTISIGTLLAIRFSDSSKQEYHLMRQLKMLWKGMDITYPHSAKRKG